MTNKPRTKWVNGQKYTRAMCPVHGVYEWRRMLSPMELAKIEKDLEAE